jgi:hypothetical protein
MRAILVDWLIEVHMKFKLAPETLFLTIEIIDRFLSKEQASRKDLQLIGVTAMLIASKYEDIYPPEVRDFVYITDKAYTKEEIIEMEFNMITSLKFNVTFPSMYRFLERDLKVIISSAPSINETDDKVLFSLAHYLIELPLFEYTMLKHKKSLIAASAIYLATKITKRASSSLWVGPLLKETKYTENEIRHCAKDLCLLLQGIERCSLKAVRKKFSLPKFYEVANIKYEN